MGGIALPFSNNAPQPIPGGYSNPSGNNMSQGQGAAMSSGITPGALPSPNGMTPGAVTGTGGGGGTAFPANGTTSTTATPGLASLNSGFGSSMSPTQLSSFIKGLDATYGVGQGTLIANMLTQGLFNPQVAQALINAMQPNIERGLVSTEGAFAGEGARFSSSAQIGVGDYESQATLGENQVLANLFTQDQQMQLNLLEQTNPAVQQTIANENSGGWLNDLLGGLEIAGGATLAVLSGGTSVPLELGAAALGATGANTILAGNHDPTANTSGMSGQLAQIQQALSAQSNQQVSSIPTSSTGTQQVNGINLGNLEEINASASAGADLGVNAPSATDGSSELDQLLQQLGISGGLLGSSFPSGVN